ncbi:hypothetical protein HDU93_002264 [Gonapodya sp. JEL0774]|nr:hypothetical protein HDU93_002264 [Gonapodya sp. JEL0774]
MNPTYGYQMVDKIETLGRKVDQSGTLLRSDWKTKTYLGMPNSPTDTETETRDTPSPLSYINHHAPPAPAEIPAMALSMVGLPGARVIALARSLFRAAGGDKDQEGIYKAYKTQAVIVKLVSLKDTLMAHQNRSEVERGRRALVSFSLSSTGIFLIGSSTRDVKPVAVYLRFRDIVVMAGERSRAFHGGWRGFGVQGGMWGLGGEWTGKVRVSLPRILPSSLPDHFSATGHRPLPGALTGTFSRTSWSTSGTQRRSEARGGE